MKVLTVCEQGLNRSVTAKWLLQYHDHDVIAVGIKTSEPATLRMLYAWADRIILLDGRYKDWIPERKLVLWDVGPDSYEHHYNKELIGKLREYGRNTEWPQEVAHALPAD